METRQEVDNLLAPVRCRFAPAPTGDLHLGSARTALFNWLAARHLGGKFLLRIEDTDPNRSQATAERRILEDLEWLGLRSDEEVWRQSRRHGIDDAYRRAAEELQHKGLVRQETDRWSGAEALVYYPPEERIEVWDRLRGWPIAFGRGDSPEYQLSPFPIIKKTGFPTYIFACVVDDIAMGITHVIRGDTLLSTTPKQLSLYNAFGEAVPTYYHVPQVHGEDGRKLSKRTGAKSIRQYRDDGFIVEGLINYLVLMGWSPGGDESVRFTVGELVERFDIDRVIRSPAMHDDNRLAHFNAYHLRTRIETGGSAIIAERFRTFLKRRSVSVPPDPKWFDLFVEQYATRSESLAEMAKPIGRCLGETLEYSQELLERDVSFDGATGLLEAYAELAAQRCPFDEAFVDTLRSVAASRGVKFKKAAAAIRVALLNDTRTPGLVELFELVGRDKAVRRLRRCAALVEKPAVKQWRETVRRLDDGMKEVKESVRQLGELVDDVNPDIGDSFDEKGKAALDAIQALRRLLEDGPSR